MVTVTNSVLTSIDRAIWANSDATVHVLNSTLDNNNFGVYGHGGSIDVANSIVSNDKVAGFSILTNGSVAPSARYTDVWTSVAGAVNYSNMPD